MLAKQELTKQALYCLSHTLNSLCSGYFGDGIYQTFCWGWPQITILLISTSQVARITGVTHPPAPNNLKAILILYYLYNTNF
jgi:hypothetical protein